MPLPAGCGWMTGYSSLIGLWKSRDDIEDANPDGTLFFLWSRNAGINARL